MVAKGRGHRLDAVLQGLVRGQDHADLAVHPADPALGHEVALSGHSGCPGCRKDLDLDARLGRQLGQEVQQLEGIHEG